MVVLGWIMAVVAVVVAILAAPWICERLVRSLVQHWRNAPPGGSAFNPMQEFVQPQIRHVIDVRGQRLKEDREGAPPGVGTGEVEIPR